MVRVIICLASLILSQSAFALTKVSATVDKNPVAINESLVLEVVADDSVNASALDTSVLLKDFIVGRTSVSNQTNMVNFSTTRTTRFKTVLVPRHTGNVIIPVLTVEGIDTNPITLNVLAKNDQNLGRQQDLFITTDISSTEVYVQQQVTLTVKLHFAAELKRGSLSEPSLENANISQVGKDKEHETILNGRRYRVIERVYAISPQKSGTFTLQSPVFSGEIMVQTTRRSNFLSFGETKPVSVIGDQIELTINPIPSSYQGTWLPSEILTLHQEWQPDDQSFMVGEPITRTLTLTVAGLSEEQLPVLKMDVPFGLKVYPDQPELHTGMNNNRLVSQKIKNFAVVASKAGEYTLPQISIPWWNTVTNKYQLAIIPEQIINVVANPELENEQQSAINNANADSAPPPVTITVKEASWLQWLFLGLWLITSFAWLITYLSSRKKSTKLNVSGNSVNTSYLALMAACKQNDGQQVLKLIIPWANSLQKTQRVISSLDDAIIQINDPNFTEQINLLQRCYFGKDAQAWQGKTMLSVINSLNKQQAIKNKTELNLNP